MYSNMLTSYSLLAPDGGGDLVSRVSQTEGEVSNVRELLFPVGLVVLPQLLDTSLDHPHLHTHIHTYTYTKLICTHVYI